MSEPKKQKAVIVYDDDMPNDLVRHDVDLSYLFNGEKELRSVKVIRDGVEFWLGRHPSKGLFWTTNDRDPKILNTITERPRGNIKWMQGGGNPHGKPKGSKNFISAKQACEKLGVHPAEFLAGIVSGCPTELRKYRIKDPKSVTVAQKIKCAELLLSRTSPALKPAEMNSEGNPSISEGVQKDEESQRIQVYLPEKGASVEIETSKEEAAQLAALGVDTYMRQHEQEYTHYDKSDEDDTYLWKEGGNGNEQ